MRSPSHEHTSTKLFSVWYITRMSFEVIIDAHSQTVQTARFPTKSGLLLKLVPYFHFCQFLAKTAWIFILSVFLMESFPLKKY